jgi:predicted GIY-YIG superfamily endonuclease
MTKAFAYMLRCSDGTFYVGSCRDLYFRLWEHQEGLGAVYTRTRRPIELVWFEEFDRIDFAFAREKQVQNWSRAKRIALIERRYADLPALAERTSRRRRRERLAEQTEQADES